jgi:DNA repair exonuclease SbcCD ATPase subunit
VEELRAALESEKRLLESREQEIKALRETTDILAKKVWCRHKWTRLVYFWKKAWEPKVNPWNHYFHPFVWNLKPLNPQPSTLQVQEQDDNIDRDKLIESLKAQMESESSRSARIVQRLQAENEKLEDKAVAAEAKLAQVQVNPKP